MPEPQPSDREAAPVRPAPAIAPAGRTESAAQAVFSRAARPEVFPAAPSLAALRRKTANRSAQWPTARWRGWCSYYRSSGSRVAVPPRMHASQRPLEVVSNAREWNLERGAPADQHIVMSAPHPVRRREPHDFPQTATHPVSFDGIADLLRHGEAETHRPVICSLTRL